VPSTAELKEDTLNSDVKNTATAFSSFLKLPAAGSRNGFNGDLNDRGSVAFLWVGAGAALKLQKNPVKRLVFLCG
jgi:hypothetical protein